MSKIFFAFLFFLTVNSACAQNLQNSVWKHSEEDYIFLLYLESQFLDITDYISADYPEGGVTLSKRYFGFYNSCELPNIDALQSSGPYYFEIDEDEINDDGSIDDYDCLELSFSEENGEEYMNIYRSSQQQFSTYRKLRQLPKNLEDFLKKERPEIYTAYKEMKK